MFSTMGQEVIGIVLGIGLGIALNQIRVLGKRLEDVEEVLVQIVDALKKIDEEE
jgi:hypothetical protein